MRSPRPTQGASHTATGFSSTRFPRRRPAPSPRFPSRRRGSRTRRANPETHNSLRRFFASAERRNFPVCAEFAAAFAEPATVDALEASCDIDLAGSYLRIEYCQDTGGFWLEPHTDIGAKLFTMLFYLSDAPDAEGWGTDIYDAALNHLGAAPAPFKSGLIFIPGADTWHGFRRRPIDGIRRSIIVNYVKPEWRSRHELAFPERPIG